MPRHPSLILYSFLYTLFEARLSNLNLQTFHDIRQRNADVVDLTMNQNVVTFFWRVSREPNSTDRSARVKTTTTPSLLSLSLLLARSCSCIAQVSRRPSRPQALYKYPITMEFTHDTGRHLSAEDQKLLDNHRSSTSYRVSCLRPFFARDF